MAYGYLKEPVEQHKDIKLAVSVLFCKDGKAMVHSKLSDKTFEIDASLLFFKANDPVLEHSEYIVDVPEKKIKLGEEPAFPVSNLEMRDSVSNGKVNGISKRLYIATAAMQGLLVNHNMIQLLAERGECIGLDWRTNLAVHSFEIADEMLKQEEK